MTRDQQIRRVARGVALAGATALLGTTLAHPAMADRGDGRWRPGEFARHRTVSDLISPRPGDPTNPDTFNPDQLPPGSRSAWELMTREQRRQALETMRRDYEALERLNSPTWGESGGSDRSGTGRDSGDPGTRGSQPGGTGSTQEGPGAGRSDPAAGDSGRPDTDPDPRDEQRAEQNEMNDRPDVDPDPRDVQRAEQQEMNDRDPGIGPGTGDQQNNDVPCC